MQIAACCEERLVFATWISPRKIDGDYDLHVEFPVKQLPEDSSLLECYAVSLGKEFQAFRRILAPTL
jgi:hypothetical protein